MLSKIEKEISVRQKILEEIYDTMQSYIYTASVILDETLSKGGSIFLFGNGKNILNIQNFTLELNTQKSLRAISLCEDIISATSIANNFGIDRIFDKQIEFRAKEGDLLIGFSASGNSKNILRALSLGRNLGCKTIGFSGHDGGYMDEFCDLNIVVPSENPSQIYEMHLIIGNIIFHI